MHDQFHTHQEVLNASELSWTPDNNHLDLGKTQPGTPPLSPKPSPEPNWVAKLGYPGCFILI
jgi:hypothetical protein